jgi:hypothetical protein
MVHTTRGRFEAPNWTKEGNTLLFNQDGKIMKIPAKGGTTDAINIGAVTQCNGSHGLSPDDKWLQSPAACLKTGIASLYRSFQRRSAAPDIY